MNEKMDAGDILYQEIMPIRPDDNLISLSRRLSMRSAEILPIFIQEIQVKGLGEGVIQNPEEATFTPIITKEMGRIDWSKDAVSIAQQIKALVAWPTAYTHLDGFSLKIFDGGVSSEDFRAEQTTPGTILNVDKRGVFISTGTGVLLVTDVQLQNKKRMGAYDLSQGYRGLAGKVVGKY